jgi:hypothetical protein
MQSHVIQNTQAKNKKKQAESKSDEGIGTDLNI